MDTRLVASRSGAAFLVSVLLPILSGSTYGRPIQTPPGDLSVEVDSGITPTDVVAILKLAKALGIDAPRRIFSFTMLPMFCEYVKVEALVEEVGPRLTYQTLRVRRNDPRDRLCADNAEKPVDIEGWVSSPSKLRTEIRWRIEDHDWRTEIRLGEDVLYDAAVQIVLAIRRNQLVDAAGVSDDLEPFNADNIRTITRTPRLLRTLERDATPTFKVDIQLSEGRGIILDVNISDGVVELLGIGHWIA